MICLKSSDIINVFNKRVEKLKTHYNKLLEEFEIEDIHGFRIEIKKLRAFIRLINTNIPKEEKIKIGEKIKSFYNTVGTIRNLQLHQLRVNSLCNEMLVEKPLQYMQLLHNEENKQKNKAGRMADKISFKHFWKKINHFTPGKLNTELVKIFVTQKQQSLFDLIFMVEYSDKALHEIRKVLKDLMYNWKYISSYLPAALPVYFTNKKNLNVFTSKLGEFHDLCIALYFFNTVYIEKIADEKEKKLLLSMMLKLERMKGMMREEINTLLTYFKQEMERKDIRQGLYVRME